MQHQQLAILGSTGSIGEQSLEIVREHRDQFAVEALSCNSNWEVMARQINEFRPRFALLVNERYYDELKDAVTHDETEILVGSDKLRDLSALEGVDTVLNSLVGFAGFEPTFAALDAGKKVALANKESMVVGGRLIREKLGAALDRLIPVDSEHSAMLQCLIGEPIDQVEKLVITASGGPFRTWSREQMENITVEEALDHPNWSMGSKITIDSATMMNKGLEIIEARWLFDIPAEKIDAVVHPQSIIHSVVTFTDGSSKAQLGPPTMKVPILYALTYPDRLPLEVPRLDWDDPFSLTFEPVDYNRFPCMKLAVDALKSGGFAPAVLNAANEIAVQRFLNNEISYIEIPKLINYCLEEIETDESLSIESLKMIDQETREKAKTY
ncbi:MAG: 1-deoxy-D-xylulose-5-phosphate reductoisomerase [Balneolaceae bacterium]|nr:1-deoxy-D-xylulose-5-phosphate reductoisomerase [Balneolaceae bacterium]